MLKIDLIAFCHWKKYGVTADLIFGLFIAAISVLYI